MRRFEAYPTTQLQAAIVLAVSFLWLLSTSLVSFTQLQTNDSVVKAWETALEMRRAAEPQSTPDSYLPSFVKDFERAAIDAITTRSSLLIKTMQAARQATTLAKSLSNRASRIIHEKAEGAKHAAYDNTTGMLEKWNDTKKRRGMRATCTASREAESHFHELLYRLTLYAEGVPKGNLETLRRRAESAEVRELIQTLEHTLEHLENKMEQIAVLWPQWFDEANDDAPLSKGLFADDAVDFPTTARGQKEYEAAMKTNRRP